MPFNYPVTEIYSATGERACVFSAEEHAARLADGWLEERPESIRVLKPYFTAPEFELMIAEAGHEVIAAPPTHKRRKK